MSRGLILSLLLSVLSLGAGARPSYAFNLKKLVKNIFGGKSSKKPMPSPVNTTCLNISDLIYSFTSHLANNGQVAEQTHDIKFSKGIPADFQEEKMGQYFIDRSNERERVKTVFLNDFMTWIQTDCRTVTLQYSPPPPAQDKDLSEEEYQKLYLEYLNKHPVPENPDMLPHRPETLKVISASPTKLTLDVSSSEGVRKNLLSSISNPRDQLTFSQISWEQLDEDQFTISIKARMYFTDNMDEHGDRTPVFTSVEFIYVINKSNTSTGLQEDSQQRQGTN